MIRTMQDLGIDLDQIARICERYGVARLEVFGSLARDETSPDGDVDLLYELAPGARLGWDIERLKDELAEAFARPVDLVSRKGLHDRLREAVLSEMRLIYRS